MKPVCILFPGNVWDGQKATFVSAAELARIYGVVLADCVIAEWPSRGRNCDQHGFPLPNGRNVLRFYPQNSEIEYQIKRTQKDVAVARLTHEH
jgi:hypothetical protein